jgi:hypothetical protein
MGCFPLAIFSCIYLFGTLSFTYQFPSPSALVSKCLGYDSLGLLGSGWVGLLKYGFKHLWKYSVLVVLLFGMWSRARFVGSRVLLEWIGSILTRHPHKYFCLDLKVWIIRKLMRLEGIFEGAMSIFNAIEPHSSW